MPAARRPEARHARSRRRARRRCNCASAANGETTREGRCCGDDRWGSDDRFHRDAAALPLPVLRESRGSIDRYLSEYTLIVVPVWLTRTCVRRWPSYETVAGGEAVTARAPRARRLGVARGPSQTGRPAPPDKGASASPPSP